MGHQAKAPEIPCISQHGSYPTFTSWLNSLKSCCEKDKSTACCQTHPQHFQAFCNAFIMCMPCWWDLATKNNKANMGRVRVLVLLHRSLMHASLCAHTCPNGCERSIAEWANERSRLARARMIDSTTAKGKKCYGRDQPCLRLLACGRLGVGSVLRRTV